MHHDHNLTTEQEIRAESRSPYLLVFWVIFGLTGGEYAFASYSGATFPRLVAVLMAMALIKVGLVGWYFMHLKFADRWIRLMLVPAVILSLVLVAALVPDMVYPPRAR